MTQPSDTNGEAPDLRDFVRAARCIDGLTHDVNNKLGAIMAYAELIELEEGLSAETKGMLRDILACVQHGTDLLDTIADTLGRPPAKPVELDLCDLVRRMGELHSYELRQARIELEINYKGDCSPIRGLKGRISRALMIILRDAIEPDVDVEVLDSVLMVRATIANELRHALLPIPAAFDAAHARIRFEGGVLEVRVFLRKGDRRGV